MMNIDQFKKQLTKLKSVRSITGKTYKILNVSASYIEFIREHSTKSEIISTNELYSLYSNEKRYNTTIAKSYIFQRVQSPAVAILNTLQSDDLTFNPSENLDGPSKNKIGTIPKQEPIVKIKDETKFFMALAEIIGEKYLLSKSIQKPINTFHLFLSNNYRDFDFDITINNRFQKLLFDLKSNNVFSSASISHCVDGLIIRHPKFKSRIVEFDEEQHFTPARRDTLIRLSEIFPKENFSIYRDICCDLNYMNQQVLKKHRIKNRLKSIPKSFIDFTKWLELSNEKLSGYIEAKNGFDFLGGRIAQRAYYDCLKDAAHLSPKNNMLISPLRFAKKTFEETTKMGFSSLSIQTVKQIIEMQLDKTLKN